MLSSEPRSRASVHSFLAAACAVPSGCAWSKERVALALELLDGVSVCAVRLGCQMPMVGKVAIELRGREVHGLLSEFEWRCSVCWLVSRRV